MRYVRVVERAETVRMAVEEMEDRRACEAGHGADEKEHKHKLLLRTSAQ